MRLVVALVRLLLTVDSRVGDDGTFDPTYTNTEANNLRAKYAQHVGKIVASALDTLNATTDILEKRAVGTIALTDDVQGR